jgi:multiple antibiotic resistance protein
MILTTFFSLISVINPFGTVPIFLGLTSSYEEKDVKRISLKVSLISMAILFSAFFIGSYILDFFQISIMSLKVSGGIVIIMSGISLINGKFSDHKGMNKRVKNDAFTKEDPSFTPLAIPMLAGPGSLSFLISLKKRQLLLSEQVGLEYSFAVSSLPEQRALEKIDCMVSQ